MKKPETGKRALVLHTKYIINGEKPAERYPWTGNRNLNGQEMSEIASAFHEAPRVGRVGEGRKKANELVAIPRGLLEYFCQEAMFFSYIHDQWMAGTLECGSQRKGTVAQEGGKETNE